MHIEMIHFVSFYDVLITFFILSFMVILGAFASSRPNLLEKFRSRARKLSTRMHPSFFMHQNALYNYVRELSINFMHILLMPHLSSIVNLLKGLFTNSNHATRVAVENIPRYNESNSNQCPMLLLSEKHTYQKLLWHTLICIASTIRTCGAINVLLKITTL